MFLKNFKKVWSLFDKKNKANFVLLIFFIIIGTFFEMFSISLLIPLVTIILDSGNYTFQILSKFNLEFIINYLNFKNFLFFFLIIYGIKTSFLVFLSHFQINFITNFFTNILNKVFKKYLYSDYLFHLNNESAKFIRNLNSEVHAATIGFTSAVLNIILDIFILSGLFALLIIFQPGFIILLISILFLLILFSLTVLRKQIRQIGKKRQFFSFLNYKIIIEALGGIKEIKVNDAEQKIQRDFLDNSILLKKTNYFYALLNNLPKLFIEFIVITIVITIMYFFLKLNYQPVEIITSLTILMGVLLRAYPSFTKLSVAFINYNLHKAAFDVIYNELQNLNYDINDDKKINFNSSLKFENEIVFKNVFFSYPSRDHKVLSNINLVFKKKEKIGIIGSTGSGKTTFVDILTGLLKPSSGEVLVDGKNINSNLKSWHSFIGYVPQKVFLNSDSLRKNIAFHLLDEKISDNKILQSIKGAQLDLFVQSLEDGQNTKVGEDGKQLSGGQRQRIGIARILYKNPEIFVFDEATSALDEQTENNFINVVENLSKEKTIFIISHKKSILKICDKVYKVENSKMEKI